MKFRNIRADEIDCRIAMIREKGLSLLLYKDARVDQNILDETVGAEQWQRHHELIGDRLYCNVGIWVDRRGDGYGEWVWKQDVGTESNTEKEKGQASDSFKRACFNWGIGRELYTAPFIWIPASKCKIESDGKKYKCSDQFKVKAITIRNKRITALTIINSNDTVVYSMKDENQSVDPPVNPEPAEEDISHDPDALIKKHEAVALIRRCKTDHIDPELLLKMCGVKQAEELTYRLYDNVLKHWDGSVKEKCKVKREEVHSE